MFFRKMPIPTCDRWQPSCLNKLCLEALIAGYLEIYRPSVFINDLTAQLTLFLPISSNFGLNVPCQIILGKRSDHIILMSGAKTFILKIEHLMFSISSFDFINTKSFAPRCINI